MHVNPEEAVRAHRDLNARYSVAMHWGTFTLTDERLDEPPRKLAEALAGAGIAPGAFFPHEARRNAQAGILFTAESGR